MKAVLVIADSLHRSHLSSLLAVEPGLDVTAAFASGRDALRYLQSSQTDLVFLDTGLNDIDPVAFVNSLNGDGTAIALLSDSDEDALLSFETHAVDYIIHPVTRARLQKTFQRLKARIGRVAETPRRDVIPIDPTRAKNINSEERMAFRSKGKVTFLRMDEIRYISAEGNYLRVHTRGTEYRFRDTMANIEGKLDPHTFLRIHRSTIVNLLHMKEIRNLPSGDAVVVLNDGAALGISRTYRDLVYNHFGQDLVG
jgi:two-component system, LytTR family, response regulator